MIVKILECGQCLQISAEDKIVCTCKGSFSELVLCDKCEDWCYNGNLNSLGICKECINTILLGYKRKGFFEDLELSLKQAVAISKKEK